MGTYIPSGSGNAGKMCSTDFYPYDTDRMIEVLDYDIDCGKTTEQIHKRIFATLRQQKRVIMIEKAINILSCQKQQTLPLCTLQQRDCLRKL